MTAAFTADDVHDALEALPGAVPSQLDANVLALTTAGTDPTMVETRVPARVCPPRHGLPAAVTVSAYVTYSEADTRCWMAGHAEVPFTGYDTAAEVAAAVQWRATELVSLVNVGARFARRGELTEALEYAREYRLKFYPPEISLEEACEALNID